MNNLPMISIIIPCRNEEKFIGKCLDSIIANDYPNEKIEILVVDGMSEDKTKDIIKQYSGRYSFIKVIENHRKIVPTALNIGILSAKGEVIIRMDSHNIYEKDYISKCVMYLNKYNVDNVGGIWITLPGSPNIIGKAIAFALSSPFGAGNAYYRIGTQEPKYVDTVPFGCYRKEVFKRIGFFDEDLVRNQDDEFNLRLIKSGGKILLAPDIVSYYYARDSLKKLWKVYFQYGYFKPLVAQKIGAILTWRQLMPVIFVSGLIISLVSFLIFRPFLWLSFLFFSLYLAISLFFSSRIAIKKDLKCLPLLLVVFFVLHASYGIGYLKGIWDFILFKKHIRKKNVDVPLTR